MSQATLTISSKNYSSWSLRGWLLCRMAGIDFEEVRVSSDDPGVRAELLLLSPSFQVPRLSHNGIEIWDTLAIGEYLDENFPEVGLLPRDLVRRSHCRSISGEMHSGFANMRSALPMNIKARHPGFKVFAGARPDIERIVAIWTDCLTRHGGPYLFGRITLADAMYAPVCSRFTTYDVRLPSLAQAYVERIMAWDLIQEWAAGAAEEPEDIDELDVEF